MIGEKRVTSIVNECHAEKTKREAGENTMMERLENDEGIE